MADSNWKLKENAREAALAYGEEIATLTPFAKGPVDPFRVIASEGGLIHAEGDDFRDSFDGRLSYHDGRFLLIYNTRYNVWPRNGAHHPKVRFSVAHELGHYYLDSHREFLVTQRKAMESVQTEFESSKQVEREADAFATGLLMPEYLVGPRVNCELDATISSIKQTANEFDVSLTSMMVRWTQLSDFPCATLCLRDGRIQWGFVSRSFQRCGLWKAKRGVTPNSSDARKFSALDSTYASFREGAGIGIAQDWLEGDCDQIDVQEFYLAIPYSRCLMVFVAAEENDLPSRWDDQD
jgi:hypothetical protein